MAASLARLAMGYLPALLPQLHCWLLWGVQTHDGACGLVMGYIPKAPAGAVFGALARLRVGLR